MKMIAFAAALAIAGGAGGTAAAQTLVMPPAVPQPSETGDLVGFILQNPGTAASAAHWITFGQVFPIGAVAPTDALAAREGTANRAVQMDVLATHPDGSVRFAAITTFCPGLAAGGSLGGMLTVRSAAAGAPVNLATLAPKLTVTLTVTGSPTGAFTQTIDLGAALQASLASGSPDYWLQGPLATEARVDVPVSSSLHLTADITGYKNGLIAADVQFNNDIAMAKTGGSFSYSAVVTLNGKVQNFANIAQDQYQDWHARLAMGGDPVINVQHDVAYLERSNAILTYDLTTGVDVSTLQGYVAVEQTAGFGAPLAANGVTTFMPTTGGRGDIGYTTQYDTVWLLTQDQRAATLGLAQGDTGGAVPWNMKLANNGHWMTPHDVPDIWSNFSGGPGSYTTGLTQFTANTVWTPDPAHQPNLAYVPYLMTASRWYLDRLNAEAAWDMTFDWPGVRCLPAGATCTASNDWHILNMQDQVRQQAWSSREIQEAGWIGRPGSFEAGYFAQVAADDWSWLVSEIPTLNAAEGTPSAWLPAPFPYDTRIAPWEEDYFSGVVVLASRMGDANAQKVLTAMLGWNVGRFNVPNSLGMNPNDGCAYQLDIQNAATGKYYTTWAGIEAGTIASGWSNGTGWSWSGGDYCALARAVLGGILSVQPTNTEAQQALTWLNGSGAPFIDQASFQADPTFNVVP